MAHNFPLLQKQLKDSFVTHVAGMTNEFDKRVAALYYTRDCLLGQMHRDYMQQKEALNKAELEFRLKKLKSRRSVRSEYHNYHSLLPESPLNSIVSIPYTITPIQYDHYDDTISNLSRCHSLPSLQQVPEEKITKQFVGFELSKSYNAVPKNPSELCNSVDNSHNTVPLPDAPLLPDENPSHDSHDSDDRLSIATRLSLRKKRIKLQNNSKKKTKNNKKVKKSKNVKSKNVKSLGNVKLNKRVKRPRKYKHILSTSQIKKIREEILFNREEKCRYCTYTGTVYAVIKHLTVHTCDKPYHCPKCGNRYKNPQSVSHHRKNAKH
eukprot:422547_1